MLERSACQSVIVSLPAPISVNAIWKPIIRGKHPALVKTAEYLAWIAEAGYALNSQRLGCVEGPYDLTITVEAITRLDLGNIEKSVSDILQAHGVITNDRLAQKITIERGAVTGMRVVVASTKAEA